MWSEVVKLLLEKALRRPTPRQQLTQAIVTLYRKMIECHRQYVRLGVFAEHELESWRQQALQEGDEFSAKWEFWEHLFVESEQWAMAVESLALTLYDLRDVLGIFDPDVLGVIEEYVERESYACGFVQRRLEQRDSAQDPRILDLAGFIGRSLPGSKVADPEHAIAAQRADAADFDSALARLRDFMHRHIDLSPDEVFDTQ